MPATSPEVQLPDGPHGSPILYSLDIVEWLTVPPPQKYRRKSSLRKNSAAEKNRRKLAKSFGLLGAISRRQCEIAGTQIVNLISWRLARTEHSGWQTWSR